MVGRVSITKKMARMTAASASRPRIREKSAVVRVIESATIRGTSPPTSAAAPGKSMSRIEAEDRTYGMVARTRRTAIRPNRQVDVEDPAPAPAVGDVSAASDRRSTTGRRRRRTGRESSPLAGGKRSPITAKTVANSMREETLNGPKGDSSASVRLAAQRRGGDEPDHAGEQERLAAERSPSLPAMGT